VSQMEDCVSQSNGAEINMSETQGKAPKEIKVDRAQNNESDMHETKAEEAEEALAREDCSENLPKEADLEDTEEETGSEGSHSETAETAPSELEAEIEETKSLEVQDEDAQNREIMNEESENDESESEGPEGEESEGEESEGEEVQHEEDQNREKHDKDDQTKEGQTEDVQIGDQSGEVQPGEVQPGEVQPGEVQPGEVQPGEVQPGEVQPGEVQPDEHQTRNIQAEDDQIRYPQTVDAESNNAEPEENEENASNIGRNRAKKQGRNVKWGEAESEPASHKFKLPRTKSSTTDNTYRIPATETPVTQENSQKADLVGSVCRDLDPKASEHTVGPDPDKQKGPAAAETPISNESRPNTPQDVEKGLNEHIDKTNLRCFYPEGSPLLSSISENAIKFQNTKGNLLNRNTDGQAVAILNLYQPVLYCGKAAHQIVLLWLFVTKI
jgi:hypothetical protein